MSSASNLNQFAGVFEFTMGFEALGQGDITRSMRVYACSANDKLHLSITDYQPVNGFGEFSIGAGVFSSDSLSTDGSRAATDNAVIIGQVSNLFVDAELSLAFDETSNHIVFCITYVDEDQTVHRQFTLQDVSISAVEETELATKCWIPYSGENLENVVRTGQSVWISDILEDLSVYDMDIFDSDGTGCWAWTDANGVATASPDVGTAGGENVNFEFKLDGTLLIMEWQDHGTWITEPYRFCRHGSTMYMLIDQNVVFDSWSCSDQVTGEQLLVYRSLLDVQCPLWT